MRVALGLSGGVDSTIAAILLKEQGYDVIGITMAKWSPESGILTRDKRGCFGPSEPDALISAERAAKKLGIEHHIIRLDDEFKSEVLDYFTTTYALGKTPNPCVICNQQIKFGALIAKARKLGLDFDRFATGHYAQVSYSEQLGRWQLFQAADKRKDQSYFLSFLTQEQLAGSLFPLGGMQKDDIREFARTRGFEYLIKEKESQDFLESDNILPLFRKNSFAPGDFVDTAGNVLGKHKGLIHYTIGQRKGLGLAGFDSPRYVISLSRRENKVVIGKEEELYSNELLAVNMNWVSIPEPSGELRCEAKVRLAQHPVSCTINKAEGLWKVVFDQPISAITPGQVLALYDGEMLLGAGFIL